MSPREFIQSNHRGRAGPIALAVALLPIAAAAQTTAPDRIDAIERHIQQLEGELQRLKRELGATRQQLRQSQLETEKVRAQALRAVPAPSEPSGSVIVAASPPPEPPSKPAPHVVPLLCERSSPSDVILPPQPKTAASFGSMLVV